MNNKIKRKVINPFLHFFRSESSSGILLLVCAIVAIIIANSNYNHIYENVLNAYISIGYRELSISMSVHRWINDGLMTIFF